MYLGYYFSITFEIKKKITSRYDFSGNNNYFPKFVFFVFSHTLHFQNHTTKFEIKYMVHACIYFTCT